MKKIIVHQPDNESRAAVLEDGRLVEFYVEKPTEELVGNIYLGKVVNVLPGMQAAFIDIGIGKNAFLYVDDAIPLKNDEDREQVTSIKKILHEGQQIIVQVQKEAFGNKGPRITTHISLPGRFIVYLPNGGHIGVSRRIGDEDERNRLKKLGEELRDGNEGIIIRTVTVEASDKQIQRDFQFLRSLWMTIHEKGKNLKTPSLIYKDLGLVARLVRDLFSDEVEQLVIDNSYEYRKLKEMIQLFEPELINRLSLYTGKEHVFDVYNLQAEIDKATKRKLWLKSGGYIIIDRTEALISIDVNTGKYIGHSNLEDTVLKTNLEAAIEIAKQLRLRDIGGIIIIDFIDMGNEGHNNKVLEVFEEEMKKDRTKSNILGFTQLGLVEMTRKKSRQSLDNVLLRNCPMCEGIGKVISEDEVFKKIEKELITYKDQTAINGLLVEVNPYLYNNLKESNEEIIKRLENISDKKIFIKKNDQLHFHQFTTNLLPETD